jgi:hypothetical protein
MFDLGASEHSVLREKVVEHIFLAELSRSLLLDLGLPFEVLRSEFDAFGYDIVIEANGVLRHIQLKATIAAGARKSVDVQLVLGAKPGGCVVWIFVDPTTLALGPYLWLGGDPGDPLPPLGDRAVRHTRADAEGQKKVRLGLRRVPKGTFTRFETMRDLAAAMFGTGPSDHGRLLARHLVDRRTNLAAIVPPDLTWRESAAVAYMIDGYALAEAAGLGDPFGFADAKRAEAERAGEWHGTTLELWVCLFMEHRRDKLQSEGPVGVNMELAPLPMLDELCTALATAVRGT